MTKGVKSIARVTVKFASLPQLDHGKLPLSSAIPRILHAVMRLDRRLMQ